MSEGVELVTAWLRLVPTLEDITENTTKAFAPGVDAAEKEGDKAGRGWASKVKGAITVAAIGTAVVATFKGLYEVGEIFDDVTDTIRTGTGAQGEALDGLVQSAKNVGLQVPAEFDQIGTTVADLNTRLGLSGSTLETVASQYLEAGRILGNDVDINATSAAFSAFQIEGDGVIDAMDSLFQVSQATGVGMNELAAGVQANAPALKNLGFGFEDSISLLGSLDKAGLNSTQVMASLSKGLVTLARDGEQPEDAFKRVTGELQGFVDAGDTASALDLASQIFGTRGASQFVGALQSGVLNMDDLMAATGATGDTILGVGEETMDFAEQWQKTMNTAMVAIEPLATAVFGAVGEGLAAVMPFLQDLGAWVGENTELIGVFAGVIGVTLVAAMVAWTASVWASTAALLANPVTWIILGITALIAAIVLLVTNWDQVVSFVKDIWGGFISWIKSGLDAFSSWWNSTWSAIGKFVSDAWTNWIVNPIKNALNWVTTTIRVALAAVSSVWRSAWQGMTDFLGSVFGGIVAIAKAPINGIISLINGAIRALNGISVDIPDWVPLVGGQTWGLSIPEIPMLAAGATILPRQGGTLAILAEAGRPETVVDTGLMNRALEEGLSGSRGDGVTINMTFEVRDLDEAAVARKARREVVKALVAEGVG